MPIAFIPTLSYVLVSTFTPGPANISSTSVAVIHGYKNAFRYQLGLALGVLMMMLLSGVISGSLFRLFPALEPLLHYIGAAYILYLAVSIARASYTFKDQNPKPLGFMEGLVLQVLNPKLWVYSVTLFATFLAPLTGNLALVLIAAFFLAAVSFVSTTVWALFGNTIKTYLQDARLKTVVNIVLALSLVYTALSLIGLI